MTCAGCGPLSVDDPHATAVARATRAVTNRRARTGNTPETSEGADDVAVHNRAQAPSRRLSAGGRNGREGQMRVLPSGAGSPSVTDSATHFFPFMSSTRQDERHAQKWQHADCVRFEWLEHTLIFIRRPILTLMSRYLRILVLRLARQRTRASFGPY